MIKYCNYDVKRGHNRVELCVDSIYMPSADEKGHFIIGTPQCWEDTFVERFSLNGYESLHIFTHLIEAESVTRITDYKGVWGLKRIPRGVYSNHFDVSGKRLYFGIDKSNTVEEFLSKMSSIVLIVPKNYHIEYDTLFSCFCNSSFTPCEKSVLSSLEKIYASFPCVIALHYSTQGNHKMTIMGNNVDSLFSEDDCLIWQSQNTVPSFHHS